MKAAYYQGSGKFELGECHPVSPGPGEVRLDVAYCGVCGTDLHIAHGLMDHRIKTPQVVGHEMIGTIAELGAGVHGFTVGQPVVVRPLDPRHEETSDKGVSHICRKLKFMGIDSPGAFQASWTVPAFTLHAAPRGIDLKILALTEPLAVAAHDVRLGQVKTGDTVVVIGGGPIGLLVGLVARDKGGKVILSEINSHRLELARDLGFETVDSSRENLVDVVYARTAGAGADVVFEVSGSKAGAQAMTTLAGLRGRVVVVATFSRTLPQEVSLWEIMWKEVTVIGVRVYEPEDFESALALVASGRLPLEKLITAVEPLSRLPDVIHELEKTPRNVKVLIDCQA
jgi:threonine dehydrogenase-like Zn-dependent dehydrogenase